MRRFTLAMAVALGLALAPARSARAAGLWLSTNDISPEELRVAIAASPKRTTVWTSLAFDGRPTTVALVLPVPDGAMVDVAPDAWLDALDVATAPRIYTSPNLTCPDGSTPSTVDTSCAAIATGYAGDVTIPTASFDVLGSPGEVTAWANAHEMAVPDDAASALQGFSGSRFVAVRFAPSGQGGGVTQTVRVVMPGASPKLVLSLFDPGESWPLVTTYLIGPGQGHLEGARSSTVDGSQLLPDACSTDHYFDMLATLLAPPGTAVLEYAGNDVWASPAGVDPAAQFDSIINAYFLSADTGNAPATTCVAAASAALSSTDVVAGACPAGAQAKVSGGTPCTEGSPGAGQVDAASLTCGTVDDLAIAFSGLAPTDVWLTRETMELGVPSTQDYPVTFSAGEPLSPIVYASAPDPDLCPTPEYVDSGTGAQPPNAQESQKSGCSGDDVAAGAEACGAVAEGLGSVGDAGDCAAGRARPRISAWTLLLAFVVAPLRRRKRRFSA